MTDKKKEISIIFTGALPETNNLGVSALLYSVMSEIFKRIPNAQLTVFDFGKGIRESLFTNGEKNYKYKLCGAHNTRRFYLRESLWNMRFSALFGGLGNPAVNEIKNADVVLDISGGDSFTDLYGPRRYNTMTLAKNISIQLKTPLVLLPQTYGPFSKNQKNVKHILKNVKAAWARDERSFKILKDLSSNYIKNKNIFSGIDVAFSLPKYEPKKILKQKTTTWLNVDRKKPVIGINVSGLIYNNPEVAISRYGFCASYKDVILGFIDKLFNSTDVNIILIPHVLDKQGHFESDIDANHNVINEINKKYRDRIEVIDGIYDQSEIKWIISKLDWFCGTRMHSTIAALSTAVPSAAIAYSDKTLGVFETCEQGQYVIDPRALDTNEVIQRLYLSFENYKQTKLELNEIIPGILRRASEQFDNIIKVCLS